IFGFVFGAAMIGLASLRGGIPETYSRVVETKTIRCGYLPFEPFVIKDPTTGKLSGVTVDYLNEAAVKEGYHVEWSSEVTFDQVVPALNSGKIDMLCVPATPDTDFVRVVSFVGDLGGLSYYVYVKGDSALTAQDLPAATFALHDGFALSQITRQAFPKATFASLPQQASMAEFFDQLRYGKVQALVNEPIAASNYLRANPGSIRRFSDTPIVSMRMFFVGPKDDTAMDDFIQRYLSVEDPQRLAIMKKALAKYHVPDGALLLGEACKPTENEQGWRVCAK
ncbi:MAG: substrate-binding periplasmic protein, partial [Bdellovibrionales bacterium]